MKNWLLIYVTIFALGCSEEISVLEVDQGYDFLPVHVGNYWTYEVEETVYEVFEATQTTFYLQDEITDSLIAVGGDVKYVVSRYRGNDLNNLTLDSVYSIRVTNQVAVFGENNQEVVKLTFPIREGISWDGNAFNTTDEQSFYYESLANYTFEDSVYSSNDAIRVIIEDVEQNLVNQDERSEVYLRNVGLVEKDYTQLYFCTVNCAQKGSEIGAVEKGKILKQKLIAYGKK